MKKYLLILFALCFLTWHSSNLFAQRDSVVVYIFLSETCPICQSVSAELRELHEQFKNQAVGFLGIFPSVLSTESSRKQFAVKYRLNFPFIADTQLALTTRFGAEVTPEVVVVRVESKEILYRGLIDNSFASVGRRRRVVTEHYLKDVLTSIQLKKTVVLNSTKPVGCIIQK